jgi:hypothetical protein
METGATKVGAASRVFAHRIGEAFELAAPYIFEVGTVGPRSCGFIKEHRHVETPPDFQAGLPRQQRALIKLDAGNGNKGNHVGCTNSRVNSLLASEVNEFGCLAGTAHCGLDYGCRLSCDGDDGAIVVRIHRPVEEAHTLNMHCSNNRLDTAHISAL